MQIRTVDDAKEFYRKSSQLPYLTTLVSIPGKLGKKIARMQKKLKSIDERQIYHHPSYFHVTVKLIGFLGDEVKEENLSRIKEKIGKAASSTAPFSLTLRGLGIFPDVVYANVDEGREQIRQLHVKI